MVVTHNLLAMNASRMFSITDASQKKNVEKLSSGFKINRAADDAAGLTISEKMRSLVRGLNQGSDNIQDGISLIQIADGALSEVNSMLHRMTELSVKSANGTNTSEDRRAIQKEIGQLAAEITRVGKNTTFNTMHILDDAFGSDLEGKVTELVSSPAAETGHMTEAYNDNGTWHAAATLDFSGVNSSNIKNLNNQYFSFTCSQSCSEAFKISFNIGKGNSTSNLEGAVEHQYSIDIKGCNSGADLVNRIMTYVSANPSSKSSGSENISPISGALGVSHSNSLLRDGNKLVILDNAGTASKEVALAKWKNSTSPYGAVDCSSITKTTSEEIINEFPIQCSNVIGDDEIIRTRRMNAQILGVDDLDLSTVDGSLEALDKIKLANSKVGDQRSELGAYQNRLEHSYDNNNNKAENTQAAESRIRDTDMATEMMKYTKNSILAQAGQAMMAQANQSTQGVLSLLQ